MRQTMNRATATRVLPAILVAAMALGAMADQAFGQTVPIPNETQDTFVELTPEAEASLEAGLRYLAAVQYPSGAWNSAYGPNIGVTALALLSFLAAGHVPDQGPYAEHLERGLQFILSHCQSSGFIYYEDGSSHGPMYEHALATLLLSQVYGMADRPDLAARIQAAVRVIVGAQNSEGGWRYQPTATDADISVTVMQILALRGAQHAGMRVPAETIDRAIEYVRSCATHGGGFLYQTNSGNANYARTGAGVCSLEVCGDYDSDEVRKGLDYLLANIGQDVQMEHFHYGVYYSAQAVYLAKDERRWQQWFPQLLTQILEQQQPDGRWSSGTGSEYGTATMVLTLAIPYRYLPIYQR